MRLRIQQLPVNNHKNVVSAVCWTPFGELYSCSDDTTICRWSTDGACLGTVCRIEDSAVTDIHWFPSIGNQVSDQFAVSCSDGTFRIYSKTGREEKRVEASPVAAIISLRWNHDGSAIASAGEDGAVKVWSRSGMLRSTIATCPQPVYGVVWGPDNDQVLYSSGRELAIKSMQADRKSLNWKAHEGVVTAIDWNIVNNLIVSSAEDCKYKVWDSFGRQLFQSAAFDYVITSVRWAPNGETFAVGAFDMIRLCDKAGWSYSREKPDSGSLFSLAWSPDGTQVVGGGGNGAVVFARVMGTHLTWQNFEVTLTDSTHVSVADVMSEGGEELDFRERVVKMSLGFGHLVVATTSQCHVYNVHNWNTPHMFDLRATPTLVLQSERHFLMVDNLSGVQLYSYDGRLLSSPKFPGLRAEVLSAQSIALAADCVAIVDKSDGGKTIRVFDVRTGHPVGKVFTHESEIVRIELSQYGVGTANRLLAFLDSNNDLYITPVLKPVPVKLQSMTDSFSWNDSSDMITACTDGNLVTFLYPNTVYVDRTLLGPSTVTVPCPTFGKSPQIASFSSSRVTVRRNDGSLVTVSVALHVPMLYEFVSKSAWEEAARLCRFVREQAMWGALCGMALQANHLDTTETALAALGVIDKLHYILYIKDIPSAVARNAELALLKRNPDEAEKILLQAQPPLLYRAIKLNINLYRWERALELAQLGKQHIDTVVGYRQRFLATMGKKETDEKFLAAASSVTVDWEVIKRNKEAEKRRTDAGGAGAGAGGKFGGGGRGGASARAAPAATAAPEPRARGGRARYSDDGDGKDDAADMGTDFKEGELD